MVSKLICALHLGVTFVSLPLQKPVLAFGSRSGCGGALRYLWFLGSHVDFFFITGWSTLILHPLPWSSGLGGGFQACGHFCFFDFLFHS